MENLGNRWEPVLCCSSWMFLPCPPAPRLRQRAGGRGDTRARASRSIVDVQDQSWARGVCFWSSPQPETADSRRDPARGPRRTLLISSHAHHRLWPVSPAWQPWPFPRSRFARRDVPPFPSLACTRRPRPDRVTA